MASLGAGVVLGFVFARSLLASRTEDDALTARQREVVRAVAAGRTTKEIALALGITPASVETHIRRARAKLGVTTRAAAAVHVARDQAVIVPWRPRRSAAPSIAWTTSATRSSNGTPMSAGLRRSFARSGAPRPRRRARACAGSPPSCARIGASRLRPSSPAHLPRDRIEGANVGSVTGCGCLGVIAALVVLIVIFVRGSFDAGDPVAQAVAPAVGLRS